MSYSPLKANKCQTLGDMSDMSHVRLTRNNNQFVYPWLLNFGNVILKSSVLRLSLREIYLKENIIIWLRGMKPKDCTCLCRDIWLNGYWLTE